jgi:flagellin-like protein
MKRKSQSEIITTILLILIVLTAVIVVWMVISRFLNLGGTADCSKVQLRIVSATESDQTVTINRMAGGPEIGITGMRILVGGDADNTDGAIEELETIGYVSAVAFDVGDTIQVAPLIMNSEGNIVTCNVIGSTRAVA